jgi:hypothetical protein
MRYQSHCYLTTGSICYLIFGRELSCLSKITGTLDYGTFGTPGSKTDCADGFVIKLRPVHGSQYRRKRRRGGRRCAPSPNVASAGPCRVGGKPAEANHE